MKITNDIRYVGVNDHSLDLFEGQYRVPAGMAYNSYVILDEKVTVLDTVDARYGKEWLQNIQILLGEREPDYLVVHHMEPDHSSNISAFMDKYKNAIVISSDKAFVMMKQFFDEDFEERRIVVKDGDQVSLGKHALTFVAAPMIHWPEVMMSYDSYEQVLFSADAFGKFGALDVEQAWTDEARRYYFGIVGKYGVQVQKLLQRAAGLDIQMICPLHGPVLNENLEYYLGLYQTWASYDAESQGTVIAYTSVYGHTREAVVLLAEELKKAGCAEVVLHDLARGDMSRAVEDAFRYGNLILATTTYNGDIFPFMHQFIHELTERGYKKRKIGMIENGSWAPVAAKKMQSLLEVCKDLTFADVTVTIRSSINEQNRLEIAALASQMS